MTIMDIVIAFNCIEIQSSYASIATNYSIPKHIVLDHIADLAIGKINGKRCTAEEHVVAGFTECYLDSLPEEYYLPEEDLRLYQNCYINAIDPLATLLRDKLVSLVDFSDIRLEFALAFKNLDEALYLEIYA